MNSQLLLHFQISTILIISSINAITFELDPKGDGVCLTTAEKTFERNSGLNVKYKNETFHANVTSYTCCENWFQVNDFCVQICQENDNNCISSFLENTQGDVGTLAKNFSYTYQKEFYDSTLFSIAPTEVVTDLSYCDLLQGDGLCTEIVKTRLIKTSPYVINGELKYMSVYYQATVAACKCCDGWTQVDNFCVQLCAEDDTDCTEYEPDPGNCQNLQGDGVCAKIVETKLIKTSPYIMNGEVTYSSVYYNGNATVCECCDGWMQVDNYCVQLCAEDDTDCTQYEPEPGNCQNLKGDGVCAKIEETKLIKTSPYIMNGEVRYSSVYYKGNVTVCECCDGWMQVDDFCVQLCAEDDSDCTEYEPDPGNCQNLQGDGVCAIIKETQLIKTSPYIMNGEVRYSSVYYKGNVTVCECCDGWMQVDDFCVQLCAEDDSDCTEYEPDPGNCQNLQGDGVCAKIEETKLIKTSPYIMNGEVRYSSVYYKGNITVCECCDGWMQVDNFCVQLCAEDDSDCTEYEPDPGNCQDLQGDGVCAKIEETKLIKTSPYIMNGEVRYSSMYYNGNVTVCECCDGWMQVDDFCLQQCAQDDIDCSELPDPSYCSNPQGDGVCTEIVEQRLVTTVPYIVNGELNYEARYYLANSTVCKCCDGWMQVDNFCVQQCTENTTNCTEYVPDPSHCKNPLMGEGVCSEIVELTQVRNISYDQFVYKVEPYQANVTMCKCCEGWLQKGNLCVPECPSSCINGNCTSPDTCTCYDGYKQDDQYNFLCNKDCSSEGCSCENGYVLNEEKNICEPVCSTPCTDGICGNPEKCHCDVGYTDSGNPYICEPACSLPCTICLAPDTCGCTDGYTLDANGYTCNAICDPECVNGECVTPNVCECNYGYTSDNATENHCIPFCDICVYGDCVAPWECECWNGEPKKNGKCGPYCPDGCSNGTFCDDPGVCRCGNYYHLDENGNCELDCDLRCDQGQCVDEVCVCYDNYFGDRCDQSSANTVERTTKVVLFLMIFIIRYLTSN